MLLKNYSTYQLLSMLDTNRYDQSLLHAAKTSNTYVRYAATKKNYFLPISQGLIGASLALDIFWSIIFVTSVSFMVMTGLIGLVCLSSLALGVGMAWKNFNKHKKERREANHELENILCQEIVYQELVRRSHQKTILKSKLFLEHVIKSADEKNKTDELKLLFIKEKINISDLINDPKQLLNFSSNTRLQAQLVNLINPNLKNNVNINHQLEVQLNNPTYKKINVKPKIIKAAVEGITLMTVMFGGFFSCGSYMLVGLGLTTAAATLSNPIAIGVLLGISTAYGLYYGYQCYQKLKLQAKQKQIINYHEQKCDLLQTRYNYSNKISKKLVKTEQMLTDVVKNNCLSSFDFFTSKRTTGNLHQGSELRFPAYHKLAMS